MVATSLCITSVPHHFPKLLNVAFLVMGTLALPPVLFSSEPGTVGHYSKYLFVV